MMRPPSPSDAAPAAAAELELAAALALAADDAAPAASAELRARLLADFDQAGLPAAPRRAAFWSLRRLIPAGALAALSAAGFLAGVATAMPSGETALDADAAIAAAFAADAADWSEI